jgi:hypothetical protein
VVDLSRVPQINETPEQRDSPVTVIELVLDQAVPRGVKSHMDRDVGLAWLGLPLIPPAGDSATRSPRKGEVVYQADFEGADALSGWSGSAVLEAGYRSAQAVALETNPNASGAVISRRLPAEALRGCRIRGSAMVRAEQVSPKPNPWKGIKFMLDALLPLCEKYGLLVVVDLHSPPGGKPTGGGYFGSDGGLFSDRQAQEKFEQRDKAQLERALQPAIAFQERYHVHLYIAEFSAIRWAPDHSAYRYLSDLIDIFEAQGWDWSYHAFREWSGWSVEHGSDRQDTGLAAAPTERQRLLRDWLARNQKPRW